MTKNKIKKPEPIRSLIFRRTYETAVREGLIDPQGKTEDEVWSEFEALYALWAKSNFEFKPILDHRSELLVQARHFASIGKYLLSCLFYATWFEHWFNELIMSGCD